MQQHTAHKVDIFNIVTAVIATIVLLFICSAIVAIIAGGISHFDVAITSEEVRFSLKMSLVTSVISTILCLILATPTVYALTHLNLPFKRAIEVFMELTLSLPYILLGFALLIIFSSPVGKTLARLGFKVVFDAKGIVLAQLIVNLPFAIRMIRTAFDRINPKAEFVAKTLGASSYEVFKTIILPLSKSSLVSTFVLVWARGMGEFGATLMLVGVTRMKTETLPGSIFLNISTGNTETAMATAMIMLLLSATALVIANLINRSNFRESRVGNSNNGKSVKLINAQRG